MSDLVRGHCHPSGNRPNLFHIHQKRLRSSYRVSRFAGGLVAVRSLVRAMIALLKQTKIMSLQRAGKQGAHVSVTTVHTSLTTVALALLPPVDNIL